jgi:hypothetical protein
MSTVAGSYRSLDGHRVTVSGPELDLSFPWSSSMLCLKGSIPFGFQSGLANNWEHLMIDFPRFAFEESYSYQGGQLRIGSAPVDAGVDPELTGTGGAYRIWLWYWQGTQFSLAFIVNRVIEGERPDFIEAFETFDLAETHEGITMVPRSPSEVATTNVEVVKEVPPLGLLTILDSASASELVPSWTGTPVAGGELFVSELSDALPAFFLLVGTTATTVIQPLGDEPLEAPARMHALETVTIAWE